jgi:hypothetical protein
MFNSNNGRFFSASSVLSSAFPTFPKAFSISSSKFPLFSRSFWASGGVGSGGDFGSKVLFVKFAATPSELIMYDVGFGAGEGRCPSERSSAGGRDLISLALAREIKGTVDDEMTGATMRQNIGWKTYHWDPGRY